jgi:hypothetical protein
MQANGSSFVQRFVAHLPGWMFFSAGLVLIGLTVLVPLQSNLAQMQWRRDVMQDQARHLGRQVSSYTDFHSALTGDDPILLQRLAYHQLNLKPAGTDPLAPISGQRSAAARDTGREVGPSIEAMLYEPLPDKGQPPAAPNSRLYRLAQGPKRVAVLAIGLVFVYVGLMLPIGGGSPPKAASQE